MILSQYLHSNRRGIALIIALAAVMVILTVIGVSLQAVAHSQRAIGIDHIDGRQRDLLIAGELLARNYIQQHAHRLVLPLHGEPIAVTDDRLICAGDAGHLRVWVYDGLAGIPINALISGQMRAALPNEWTNLSIQSEFKGAAVVEQIPLPPTLKRYPFPIPGTSIAWSAAATAIPTVPQQPPPALSPLSFVEVVAVASNGRINRNTAPRWLLEAVYSYYGDDGLNQALQRRERGIFDDHDDPEDRQPLRLVAVSNRWQALIETTWNDRQRRWWIELVGNADEVTIVQRHAIDE